MCFLHGSVKGLHLHLFLPSEERHSSMEKFFPQEEDESGMTGSFWTIPCGMMGRGAHSELPRVPGKWGWEAGVSADTKKQGRAGENHKQEAYEQKNRQDTALKAAACKGPLVRGQDLEVTPQDLSHQGATHSRGGARVSPAYVAL